MTSHDESAHQGAERLDRPRDPNLQSAPLDWDERYASAEQMWSGNPNSTLVALVENLEPGSVLDVGCGEGADAIWLADRGWQVTAIDVSRVAIDRGKAHAQKAGVDVEWRHCGLVEANVPPQGFTLVSAQYPALLRSESHDAERALLSAVAPGRVPSVSCTTLTSMWNWLSPTDVTPTIMFLPLMLSPFSTVTGRSFLTNGAPGSWSLGQVPATSRTSSCSHNELDKAACPYLRLFEHSTSSGVGVKLAPCDA